MKSRVLSLLYALAAASSASAAGLRGRSAAKDGYSPVPKVVSMLEDLSSKITAQGQKEAADYDKFACFCKKETDEKNYNIEKGSERRDTLQAEVDSLTASQKELADAIALLNTKVADQEASLKTLRDKHAADKAVFETSHGHLSTSVGAINRAVVYVQKHGGASKEATSLIQEALALRNDPPTTTGLGYKGKTGVANSYEYQSGDILSVLTSLRNEFQEKKLQLEADWTDATHAFDQEQLAKEYQLETTKAAREAKIQESSKQAQRQGAAQQELNTVQANLDSDNKSLTETVKRCESFATEWDTRSKTRADELAAISEAVKVLKGPVAEADKVNKRPHESFLRTARKHQAVIEAAASLLETASRVAVRRDIDPKAIEALRILKEKNAALKSHDLGLLVSAIEEDPFVKVRDMIKDLIEKLLDEQSQELDHKQWCDDRMSAATKSRDDEQSKKDTLTGEIAVLRAKVDDLTEQLALLAKEQAELTKALNEASELRTRQAGDNQQALTTASDGSAAVGKAIDVLKSFYSAQGEDSKSGFAFSLAQVSEPEHGADPFKKEYHGEQGAANGVLGLLETIKSDFDRTVDNVKSTEKNQEDDFRKYEKETKTHLSEKATSTTQFTQQKSDASSEMESKNTDLDRATQLLDSALKELKDLEPTCVTTGGSYKDRKARREEEIEALKEALAIFESTSFNGKKF